mgnify:CR=1 FL=1
MANVSPLAFLKQVRMEMRKVTWPTRSEATVTTVMVMLLAVIAAIFFLAADGVISTALHYILK